MGCGSGWVREVLERGEQGWGPQDGGRRGDGMGSSDGCRLSDWELVLRAYPQS